MTDIRQSAPPPPDADIEAAGRSLWSDAWRRLRRDRAAMVCLGVIGLYVLIAVGGVAYAWLSELDPNGGWLTYQEMVDTDNTNQPPKPELSWNVLGTDWEGKPVLVKVLMGAKTSISVGIVANLIAVPLGLALGVLAGYFGRATDAVIVWLFSTLASIPGIILLIAIRFAFKNVPALDGIYGMYVALGVISWIGTCRLVRAETLKLRELEYVMAAQAAGRRELAILAQHIVPNVLHIGIIRFSLGFVGAVQAEVILSYLGLGVAVGEPSWGRMIDAARLDLFAGQWWEITAAVGAMFFLVLALNIFGDRLRDALDPRLRNV